ncbi:MAG: hypothetical protein IH972_04135 [Candidatus Marinimicrobia bacterium]|nr:hypothetical protein [Candidatus Neomarinimicrobiota bacterium]
MADYSGTDYQKLTSAITAANAISGLTIIYIPAGTYTFSQTVNITTASNDGIIFLGAGSGSTVLSFSVAASATCINVAGGTSGSTMSVTADGGEVHANETTPG